MTAPAPDQIEVTLFGPGFGEAIVVHLGDNRWLLVDSCVHPSTGESAALTYLSSIGVDAAQAVCFILATHWHDDHVRGMSRVVEACNNARFGCPTVFTSSEFLAFAATFDKDPTSRVTGGAREILTTFRAIADDRHVQSIQADRLLCGGTLSDGRNYAFWALSPSDLMYQEFLRTLVPPSAFQNQTKRRADPNNPNFASVVSRLDVGELSFLFGADMQIHASPHHGWNAVRASATPQRRAIYFKVPHHGSENAHDDYVWQDLLVKDVTAVTTPWRSGGRHLPTQSDVARLRSLTRNAYCTSNPDRRLRIRDPAVERTIRESPIQVRTLNPTAGMVRARFDRAGSVAVDYSQQAFRL